MKRIKKTHEEFIKQVYELVGNEYILLENYINDRTKILTKHNKCGNIYYLLPSSFIQKRRCPYCAGNIKKTTGQFKQEVFNLVKNEYEVLGEYINTHKCILIKHNKCDNILKIRPKDFLKGIRCSYCSKKHKKTTGQFKQEVFNLVKNEYEVLGEYINSLKKIKIKHTICNTIYYATPNSFLNGSRCTYCMESKGEKKVEEFLNKNNINHKKQYKINGCKNKKSLRFDFAIFDKDILEYLIEYDGILHYKNKFNNIEFQEVKHRDNIKNEYCKNNNIKLIRIPYWEYNNIESILERELLWH